MARQQTKYKVLGTFACPHAPRVQWDGWTQDRALAEKRLAEAEAYDVKRQALSRAIQPIAWKISEITVAASVAERVG